MPPGLFRHHYVAPAVLGLCGVVALTAVADKSAHAAAAAGLATIRLTSERDILLADGKSTTIVTAEVRDDQGRVVRDGTVVRFSTTGGRLETTSAVTQNGVARVTLTSADLPGAALVTANLESPDGQTTAAPAQIAISFSSDAENVNATGGAWANVRGADYTGYALDSGIIQANGRDGGARVTYRGLEIRADTLQLNVRDNSIRANGNVVLRRGDKQLAYRNLRYEFMTGKGFAERDVDGLPRTLILSGPALDEAPPGPSEAAPPPELWALEDLSEVSITVVAQSIALEPNVRLQFRRATFYLDGAKTLSLPFHVMSLSQESIFAEQILGYGPSGVTFDFPLFYDVRPETIGTFHVRHGARVGASAYSTRPGWTLDLEHAYNRATAADGRVEVTGLTRRDWGARWSHSQRFDGRSRGNFYVDFPNHSDLFANTQLSRRFGSVTLNALASGSRTSYLNPFPEGDAEAVAPVRTTGGDLRTQIYAQTDPRGLIGGARRGLRYTVNLSTARHSFFGPTASGESLKPLQTRTASVRLFSSPLPLGRGATVSQSLSLGHTWTAGGFATARARDGATVSGTLSLTQVLRPRGSATLTYDYSQAPSLALFQGTGTRAGRHRLAASAFLGRGDAWDLSLMASRALDAPNATLFGNLQFALGGPWRGRIRLSSGQFSRFRYQDVEYSLIRRIAGRDVAVYYSTTSRRFQLDFTGARF